MRRRGVLLALPLLLGVACNRPAATTAATSTSPANSNSNSNSTQPAGGPTPNGTEVTMSDGLQYTDEVVGTGAEATTGKTAVVNYTGWLMDGTKFDSSLDRNQPFSFPLGAGQVIKGWDEGVAGMRVGGKRVLIVPPQLGYGARGAGGVIPPNATLKFEVQLLDVH
jgi:FKBP-type peptidyl-prolyl cis-trans isomerase FkpA